MAMNKFGQDFGHDNRAPSSIANRMDSNTRKKNFLLERNELLRRKASLELYRQDVVDEHDALIVQARSAAASLKGMNRSDADFESLSNGRRVAAAKAARLVGDIANLDEKIAGVQTDIDANLAGLKAAIDAEIGAGGRAEVRGMIERGAADAMALCGELRSKLEAFEKYREGLTADAAAELDRLTESAEAIWRSVQKI